MSSIADVCSWSESEDGIERTLGSTYSRLYDLSGVKLKPAMLSK